MSRSKILVGLNFLQIELVKNGFCEDISQIASAITQIKSGNANQWGYQIVDLPINLKGTAPNSNPILKENGSIIYLTVSISENKTAKDINNLILSSDFSILIKGVEKKTGKEFYTGWHLDNDYKKHGSKQENSKNAYYIHPQYHISFGGAKLENLINYNPGDHLSLKSPRLPHPPMDIFLAIDFILEHFICFDEHQNLTRSPSYIDYINFSQARLWRPYYTAIAKNWCPSGCPLSLLNDSERYRYLPQLDYLNPPNAK
ncbi:MAG: hypothetical protein ACK5KT_01620 [Dysgonomonas sp.]